MTTLDPTQIEIRHLDQTDLDNTTNLLTRIYESIVDARKRIDEAMDAHVVAIESGAPADPIVSQAMQAAGDLFVSLASLQAGTLWHGVVRLVMAKSGPNAHEGLVANILQQQIVNSMSKFDAIGKAGPLMTAYHSHVLTTVADLTLAIHQSMAQFAMAQQACADLGLSWEKLKAGDSEIANKVCAHINTKNAIRQGLADGSIKLDKAAPPIDLTAEHVEPAPSGSAPSGGVDTDVLT